MRADLRHLMRSLRRSPASAIAAVLSLSVTLGAAAAIGAVVDAMLLTPPPFADPATLVTIGEVPVDDAAAAPRAVSAATFDAWQARAGRLASLEAGDPTNAILTGFGPAERVSTMIVTPGYLTLLGVVPALGRSFVSDDLGRPVVIVSHGFWRAKLAADPAAIGTAIVLSGLPHTVIGVLPESLANVDDFWRPFAIAPAAARTGLRVRVVARLARGVTAHTLAGALDDVSGTSSPRARAVATPLAAAIAGQATQTLGLIAAAGAIAVAIAFANLAGLLIVRAIDRRRELAVRTALGARGSQIARPLLLESAVLAVVGTVGGVLLALWMTPVAAGLATEQFGAIANRDIAVSWRVVGVLSILAAACTLICGSLPAIAARRQTAVEVLRRGVTAAPRELMLRRAFVAAEIALAFVLLVSLTFVGRSLREALAVNPGFRADGVMAMSVSLPTGSYPGNPAIATFYASLHTGLEARFGAGATAVVDELPLTGDRGRSLVGLRSADPMRETVVRVAGPQYFEVMRIPIVAGRAFDATDHAAAPRRAVISRRMAEQLFASPEIIGRQIWLAAAGGMVEVIGVVGDVTHRALDEAPLTTVYLSAWQAPSRSSKVVVRSARSDGDVLAAVREEVATLDPALPVYGGRPMREVVAASPGVPARRVIAATFAGFGALAVILGAIGLFGVAAHEVTRRRAELALRIALGADRRRILRAIFGQSARLLAGGLLAGGILSFWAFRVLGSAGFVPDGVGVSSVVLPAAVLVLAGVAAVLPTALRAGRTDPIAVLRAE